MTTHPTTHNTLPVHPGLGDQHQQVLEFLAEIHRQHPGAWSLTTTIDGVSGLDVNTVAVIASLSVRHLVASGSIVFNGERRSIVRINPPDLTDSFNRSIQLATRMFKLVDELNTTLAKLGRTEHAQVSYMRKSTLIIDHHNGTTNPTLHKTDHS